jgi:allantoinase
MVDLDDIMDRLPYSPVRGRPPIRWPGEAQVAVWLVVNTEHYEYVPPASPYHRPFPRVPAPPDVQQYSFREYGNRVGFWRLLELLDDCPIPVTASINIGVLELFPQIGAALAARGWDCMSHGLYNTRAVFGLSADEERAEIEHACATFHAHTGRQLNGMLGPTVSVTTNTFDLMAECGMSYTADVFHDDQPAPVLTRNGRLVSIPYTVDLNDGNLYASRSMDAFVARSAAQFRRLWREGADSGTVMCLALHPYIVGQPQFIATVRALLDDLAGREGVWFATASDIVEHYLTNCYDEQLDFALHCRD